MSTTLCLDFGNTRRKAAIFDEDKLIKRLSLENEIAEIQLLINEYQPANSILSSVVNHSPDIELLLAENSTFHLLGHQTKLPFTTPVSKPETIGADRLAISAAAVHLFPEQNNLAIGLGTCVTYNFINKDHAFLGGAISHGVEMCFKVMKSFTAQ